MANHRMWPSIEPRIAGFIPGIDAGQVEVAAAGLDKERGDHIITRLIQSMTARRRDLRLRGG